MTEHITAEQLAAWEKLAEILLAGPVLHEPSGYMLDPRAIPTINAEICNAFPSLLAEVGRLREDNAALRTENRRLQQ